MDKPSIQQVDNFFPDDVASKVSEFITDYAAYRYGETDNRNAPPTGLVADLSPEPYAVKPTYVHFLFDLKKNPKFSITKFLEFFRT